MSSYDVVIFDCDGVILDSNAIKNNAFSKALEDEPQELIDKFIAYHKANGGISRYIKFQYFFDEIKKEPSIEKLHNALEKYASIVQHELISCNYIKGVESYIEHLNQNDIKCYVNSGSDEKELIEVFKKRGLINKFQMILGSPNTKQENIKRILNQLANKKVLYFGDAALDMKTAEYFGYDFIFIYEKSDWTKWREKIVSSSHKYYLNFDEYMKKGSK